MKRLSDWIGKSAENRNLAMNMYKTIMDYIADLTPRRSERGVLIMSEKRRQYYTWGAKAFTLICSDDGCYGIQFKVSGLRHCGRVRIYYNRSTDYFDIELLRPIKNEVVYELSDVDCFQLHNVLHRQIERTDDAEV